MFADLRQAGHYHEGPDERHRVGDRRARCVPVQDHQRRAQRLAGQSSIPFTPYSRQTCHTYVVANSAEQLRYRHQDIAEKLVLLGRGTCTGD